MKVTWIEHSGFLVETAEEYLLFDYWKGRLPRIDPGKPLCIFVSHSHPDHFSERICDLPAKAIVLSADVPQGSIRRTRASVHRIAPHRTLELSPCLSISTLASNDLGVAYVVRTDEGMVYHAGDLNSWWWDGDAEDRKLEEFYHRELERIRGIHFRAAMIPYDLRLKEPGYGIRDFQRVCSADAVFGMHLNGTIGEAVRRAAADTALRESAAVMQRAVNEKEGEAHVYFQSLQL